MNAEKAQINEMLTQAQMHEKSGNVEKAASLYMQVIYMDPKNKEALDKLLKLKKLKILKSFCKPINDLLALSHSKQRVAVIIENPHTLTVLNTKTGSEIIKQAFSSKILSLSWSPDDNHIAVLTSNNMLHLLYTSTGQAVRKINLSKELEHTRVAGMHWFRKDPKILIGTECGFIIVKNPLRNIKISINNNIEHLISSFEVHPSENYIAVSGRDGIYIHQIKNNKISKNFFACFMDPEYEVGSYLWSEDGSLLIISHRSEIAVADFKNLVENKKMWPSYVRSFKSDEFFFNKQFIKQRLDTFYHLTPQEQQDAVDGSPPNINVLPVDMSISPNNKYLAVLYNTSFIAVWNLPKCQVVYRWRFKKPLKDKPEMDEFLQKIAWLSNNQLLLLWITDLAVLDLSNIL